MSDGPGFHGAITAYRSGATGAGVILGIIDSGIDVDSPEFAGRIHSGSRDFAGNRGLEDEGGHGTQVAQVAAGARNNSGTLGIAFDSQILVLRTDSVGSCTDTSDPDNEGCSYGNNAIASALDSAVTNGARIVNLSIGGTPPPLQVRQAIGRATDAGIIIVVSAGNDGDITDDPAIDPDNPDPFATGLQESGNGLVIIAGSVSKNGQISDFSNRAGSFSDSYLTALGDEICCVYENGEVQITRDGQGRSFVTLFSGTSFSAPQISGAAALLAQAFPNLTGRQIVDLLLSTGRDAGASGTDAVYGRGILDIAAAFRPQGGASLAGTNTSVSLSGYTGTTSAPMGDAGQRGQHLDTIVLDSYDRAYAVDLGNSLRAASRERKLDGAISGRTRSIMAGNEKAQIALTIAAEPNNLVASVPLVLIDREANQTRILAGSIMAKVAPGTQLGFGIRRGADGLVAGLQGQKSAAFLIAESPRAGTGFARVSDSALAVRHKIGNFGLTGSIETGNAQVRDDLRVVGKQGDQTELYGYSSAGIGLDREWAGGNASLGLTLLDEDQTVLGGKFADAFGGNGAATLFVDAETRLRLGHGWNTGFTWRQGYSQPRDGGALVSGSALWSTAFALDIGKSGVMGVNDSLSFRFSQPLRISSGGIELNLPVSYDYRTRETVYDARTLNLAPEGRELVSEFGYARALWGGYMSANLYYRTDPGHYSYGPDDKGVAMQFQTQF